MDMSLAWMTITNVFKASCASSHGGTCLRSRGTGLEPGTPKGKADVPNAVLRCQMPTLKKSFFSAVYSS